MNPLLLRFASRISQICISFEGDVYPLDNYKYMCESIQNNVFFQFMR